MDLIIYFGLAFIAIAIVLIGFLLNFVSRIRKPQEEATANVLERIKKLEEQVKQLQNGK